MFSFFKKVLKKKVQKKHNKKEKEHPNTIDIDNAFERAKNQTKKIINAIGNLKIEKIEFKKVTKDEEKQKNNIYNPTFKNNISSDIILCSKCGKEIAKKSDLKKADGGKPKENVLNKVKIIIKIEPKGEKTFYKLINSYNLCDDCLKDFHLKFKNEFKYFEDVFDYLNSK